MPMENKAGKGFLGTIPWDVGDELNEMLAEICELYGIPPLTLFAGGEFSPQQSNARTISKPANRCFMFDG